MLYRKVLIKELINLIILIYLIFSLLLLMFYIIFLPDWEQKFITVLSALAAIGGLIVIYNKIGLGLSIIYLLYLSLSHLGVPVSLLFDSEALLKFRKYAPGWLWIDNHMATYSIALSGLGIISFSLTSFFISNLRKKDIKEKLKIDYKGPKEIYTMGFVLLIISTFYLIGKVVNGELQIAGTYSDFRDSILNLKGYPWVLFLLATGLSFISASGDKKAIKQGFILFLIPSFLLVIGGNRGEVLYPLAGAVGILFLRKFKVNFKILVLSVLVFFILIPSVFQLRQQNIGDINIKENLTINITDPFVEIGHALRPLIHTTNWIENGESFGHGASYLLPIQRMIGIIPFLEKPQLDSSNKHYLKERLPTQGYSVLAEAYYNFGKIGILMIPALISLVLFILGDKLNNYWSLAIAGAISAVLVNNVRNTFIFVPGQILMIVILLLITWLIYNYRLKIKNSVTLEGEHKINNYEK